MPTTQDQRTRPLVSEFPGAVHAWPSYLDVMREIGLGWSRIQPAAEAPPDLSNALYHGDLAAKFAQLTAADITLLPILDYSAEWAAVSPPHINRQARGFWYLSHPYPRGLRYLTCTFPDLNIDAIAYVERVSVRGHSIAHQAVPNPNGLGVVVHLDPTDTTEHIRALAEVRPLTKKLSALPRP